WVARRERPRLAAKWKLADSVARYGGAQCVDRRQSYRLGRRILAPRERGRKVVDGRRPGEPHLFLLWMADDVLQRFAEHAEPVGLTYDHRVQCDAAYERLFCRLA